MDWQRTFFPFCLASSSDIPFLNFDLNNTLSINGPFYCHACRNEEGGKEGGHLAALSRIYDYFRNARDRSSVLDNLR